LGGKRFDDQLIVRESGPSGAGSLTRGFQGTGAHHFNHVGFMADRTFRDFPGTKDQFFKLEAAILADKFVNRHGCFLKLV